LFFFIANRCCSLAFVHFFLAIHEKQQRKNNLPFLPSLLCNVGQGFSKRVLGNGF